MVFDRPYAGCYDLFYRDKNYESECDMLEEIFSKRSITPSTIIDLGCGTARHAVLLAQRGYSVTGVDRSEEMLQIASERIKEAGCEVSLLRATCPRRIPEAGCPTTGWRTCRRARGCQARNALVRSAGHGRPGPGHWR